MNIMNFMDTAFPTGTPQWTTNNYVVMETPAIKLRCFRKGEGHPTLVVPPQAGHSSHIADYDKGQSLIETVLKERRGPVYCIEWKTCTSERKEECIEDLVAQLKEAYAFTGPAHIVGLCQGGWLSSILVSRDNSVLSFMPIAAPLDFHGGGGTIYETVTKNGMGPYRAVVETHNGIMPGSMMLLGWKLMHPVERFVGDYMSIFNDMLKGDERKMAKIKRFRTWYEYVQDIAGTWYLEAVENLFLLNRLDLYADLDNIKCPVVMIAGELDDITLESHLFVIDGKKVTIPKCGHVGCFMGSNSQSYIAEAIRYLDKV